MNERPKALTDAECRSAMLADICCSQAERIAVLEAALRAALNMVDGDGCPPDWDRLRGLVSK
jgi:hypothetical protein